MKKVIVSFIVNDENANKLEKHLLQEVISSDIRGVKDFAERNHIDYVPTVEVVQYYNREQNVV